jgi:photosystem II stability/assembly factor-like uncharacterized protein
MKRSRRIFLVAAALAALATPLSLRAWGAAPFGSLHYRSIGPAISGGRTTAVAGSDRDPLVYYAGGADGGVFKSADGGASWKAVFDGESAAAIGAIAVAGGDENDVWVGTGESNPRNDVAMGDGIYHSTDGGATWTHAGLVDAGAISSISIDPRNARVVVVGVLGNVFRDGATRGVFVTRDGGAHWTRTLYVGPSSGVSDLVRLPGNPSTIFAGVNQVRRYPWALASGGPQGGLYRSDDGGLTWRRLSGNGLPSGLTGRIGLSASGRRIYAIVASKQGDLWRSDDAGATWRLMPHSPYVGDRTFYFSHIFADPAIPDRALVVGLILGMTTDGGKTFKPVSEDGGWDFHSVWWSADGRRIVVGSDEGVTLSAKGGVGAWWQPYDLPFSQPYHIGLDTNASDYRVCVGLQDNSSWCAPGSSDNGIGVLNRDWYTVGPGDGMWAVIDPTNPGLIWSTSTNNDTGEVYRYDPRTKQAPEAGPNMRANGDEPPFTLPYRFNWDTPIAFATNPLDAARPQPPRVLVGGNVLFASDDRGQTWNAISPDLTRNEKEHQQASGGPIDQDMSGAETSDTILDVETTSLAPQTVWVGTDDGLVQLTSDMGAHWSNVTPPGIAAWSRIGIEPGHASEKTAYVSGDRHLLGDDRPYLFVTDDGGATWSSIAGDLPRDRFVRVVREDRANSKLLFAGTNRGIYVTYDRGRHWQSLRLNMPATAIYDMQIAQPNDDLVVAAHGRGVWILDDLRPLEALAAAMPSSVTLYAPRTAVRAWRWAPVNSFPCCSGTTLPANDFVGENAPYGALLTYYLPQKLTVKPDIDVVDASGRTIRHLGGGGGGKLDRPQRAARGLAANGPVKWTSANQQWNEGADEGPEAVPGTYTVRLRAGGRTYEQSVTVDADPRAPISAQAAQARHDFLASLFNELGGVDTWLNALDKASSTANAARRAELHAFGRKLTYYPRNVEDLSGPLGLRERIGDAIARAGTSLQPPTAAQVSEAAVLKELYDGLSTEYAQLMKP